MEDPRLIACFHLNQIGDVLFSLPALHNLKAKFPQARVVSVVRPQCAELLRLSGLVDEIVERPHSVPSDVSVARRLARRKPDLALLFSTSFAAWAMALLSGARARVGFTARGLFLTQRVPWAPPPSMQNNLRLVEAIGCPAVKRDYVGLISPGEAERDAADCIIREAGLDPADPFAVLCSGTSTGREIKRWSDEGFAEVADRLSAEHGLKPLVVGVGGGAAICDQSKSAVDLTGKTPLPVLAAVLQKARVFIGVDSGVMHLAAAVGTPVIGLFGPSDPTKTGPQGEGHHVICVDLPCRPCLTSRCDLGRACMERITPEMVLSAASSLGLPA